jgi:hypothetical protein
MYTTKEYRSIDNSRVLSPQLVYKPQDYLLINALTASINVSIRTSQVVLPMHKYRLRSILTEVFSKQPSYWTCLGTSFGLQSIIMPTSSPTSSFNEGWKNKQVYKGDAYICCIELNSECTTLHFKREVFWLHQQKTFPSVWNGSVRVDALRQSRQRHPGGGVLHARHQCNASRCILPSECCFAVSSSSVGLLI